MKEPGVGQLVDAGVNERRTEKQAQRNESETR
jgi:hypothetical protein